MKKYRTISAHIIFFIRIIKEMEPKTLKNYLRWITKGSPAFKMRLAGTANNEVVNFKDYEDSQEGIFPIVCLDDKKQVNLLGTGFYISSCGVFVTAKHVLEHVLDENYKPKPGHEIYIIQFLKSGGWIYRPIAEFSYLANNNADIVVGTAFPLVNSQTQKQLATARIPVSFREIKDGEKLFVYGYPNSIINKAKNLVVYYFQPEFYTGSLIKRISEERYQTSIHIHGGASGGPVFNSSGGVVGICRSSFGDEPNLSFITPIKHILNIPVRRFFITEAGMFHTLPTTISELCKSGDIVSI